MPEDHRGGQVLVAGEWTPYHVRHSPRAARRILQIHPRRGLEVVLPAGDPLTVAPEILRIHQPWLLRHAAALHQQQRPRAAVRDGSSVPYRGGWLPLRVVAAARRGVRETPEGLRLATPAPDDSEAVRAVLLRWYRQRAAAIVPERVQALHRPADGPLGRILLRDQATRWASCSTTGTLSFNWRLVMTPPPVLDMVVTHELVHLRIADHSARFWRALDARAPHRPACDAWLDRNGPRLVF